MYTKCKALYGKLVSSSFLISIEPNKFKFVKVRNLSFIPLFYIRYIDDITLAAPCTLLNELLEKFDFFRPKLKFTMKIGGILLNFLKLTFINRDRKLIFDWFHKPTFSGKFLNFHSKHPEIHKRDDIITSLADKVLLLSIPEFQQKNFLFIINILLDNNYPLDFIFFTIKKKLSVKF